MNKHQLEKYVKFTSKFEKQSTQLPRYNAKENNNHGEKHDNKYGNNIKMNNEFMCN